MTDRGPLLPFNPKPPNGTRWVTWKGTTWIVVGTSNSPRREFGEQMVTVQCVGRSEMTRYPLGAQMDAALSWFGTDAQPESTGR
jgi:hypothetical protein